MQNLPEEATQLTALDLIPEDVKYLSINARDYQSPMTERAKCLVEAIFLLTLHQDFITGTRVDGRMNMDDWYFTLI